MLIVLILKTYIILYKNSIGEQVIVYNRDIRGNALFTIAK